MYGSRWWCASGSFSRTKLRSAMVFGEMRLPKHRIIHIVANSGDPFFFAVADQACSCSQDRANVDTNRGKD